MATMTGEKRYALGWIEEHAQALFRFSPAHLELRRAGLARVQIGESLLRAAARRGLRRRGRLGRDADRVLRALG